MADIILDTNILADLLAQYFEEHISEGGYFKQKGLLTQLITREINRVLRWYLSNDETPSPGLIIASTFAFVEIARQFDNIVKRRFTVIQFAAFVEQPPEWFFISALDRSLFPHLSRIPREIFLPNGNVEPIEWTDAVHIATTLSRDEPCFLATTDRRIKAVELLKDKVI